MALTMMQQMAIWDSGKCKCPVCGKYRKPDQIPDQPATVTLGDDEVRIIVSVLPKCIFCLQKY